MLKYTGPNRRVANASWLKLVALYLVVMLVLAVPAAAFAQTPFAAKLSDVDTTFLTGIGQTNLGEIAAANLALLKSSDPLVLAFAHTMIDDHLDAENQVRDYAAGVQFALPNAPAAADAAGLASLKSLNGHRFDVAYLSQQETGHVKAIALTQREIAFGTQRDIAGLAAALLPAIEYHRELATRDLASLNDPIQSGELGGRR